MPAGIRKPPAAIRIDHVEARLWLGAQAVALRPKTWAVLCYLTARAGALVSKNELLDAIWPDTVVSEGTLNKSIAELRTALGEDRERPHFIETVSRRGFRWIGGATDIPAAGSAAAAGATALAASAPSANLVGREAEMAALERSFLRAAAGTRQVVFVTGEAGAGKSTLVDAFLARLEESRGVALTTHGQCIESSGQHEPYRPILESVERLARRNDVGASVVSALRSHAPTWLRQMPSLAGPDESSPRDDTATPSRMLREIAAALEEISRDRTLVVILEDAHWADLATMDAFNLLARRRDPARLMLVVTLRAADALVAQHPALAAKSELTSRGLATELPVRLFTPDTVQHYLEQRCGGLDLDPELPEWIHHQTAGNPLFVRIVVDELIQGGTLTADSDGRWRLEGTLSFLREFVPDSLRELVERQFERLRPSERSLTEAASVLPVEFTASAVAAAAGLSGEDAEEICTELARRGQLLRRAGRGGGANPDSSRFAFVHSMVQRIVHDRIPATRLRHLHLTAAERLQRDNPDLGDSVAVQLALHYAMAEDPAAAILHLQRAADAVGRIPAPREVIVIRERILELVERNPNLPGHRRERVVATMNLAQARQLAFAVVDAETAVLCERVLALAVADEDVLERFQASVGIYTDRIFTGRYREAHEIARQLFVTGERYQFPLVLKTAHHALSLAEYRLGDFAKARAHSESCLRQVADVPEIQGWDLDSMSLASLALLSVHSGHPAEARRLVRETDERGCRERASPDDDVGALLAPALATVLTKLRDDADAMVQIERSLSLGDHIGTSVWLELVRFLHGLLISRQGRVDEGVRRMKESLARQARIPVYMDRSLFCSLLADEMLRRRLPGAGPVVEDGFAFMERSGERHSDSELYRVRAELRVADGDAAGAESDFRQALAYARERGSRWNELVASTGLARLLHGRMRSDEALALLSGASKGFENAGDFGDVRDAHELLASLS